MGPYHVAYEPDLGCYPNYSFQVADVDGDGRLELITATQRGDLLRVIRLDGRTVFERELPNKGTWGTITIAVADLDGDGRGEIVVPCPDEDGSAAIAAFEGSGHEVGRRSFGTKVVDAYSITVPLLAAGRLIPGAGPGILAAVAGGSVVAMDAGLRELWRVDGLREVFGHEFHVADIDADGCDEVAFCTMDSRGGELVVLDHDGATLLRRNVRDYAKDTHFDDVAMADFLGSGGVQVLLEKGVLIDLEGNIIWDVSDQLTHGQWIAHTPDPGGAGRLIYIATLWDKTGTSGMFSREGRRATAVGDLPRTRLDPERLSGWSVLSTRPHFVDWGDGSEPDLFVSEQALSPTSHNCFATEHFSLCAHFLDTQGQVLGAISFPDAQIEGYWYNGEVASRVADVDGDGRAEVIFPRQSGRVMVIKKG
jgi:hypothetical protein